MSVDGLADSLKALQVSALVLSAQDQGPRTTASPGGRLLPLHRWIRHPLQAVKQDSDPEYEFPKSLCETIRNLCALPCLDPERSPLELLLCRDNKRVSPSSR